MTLRRAIGADLPAVVALNVESWRDAYASILSPEFLGAPVAEYLAAKWAAIPDPGFILLDDRDAGIAGFAAVRLDAASPGLPPAFVSAFHVRPGLRGRGIGTGLLSALLHSFQQAGIPGLWLEVARDNPGARAFYAAQGGREGAVYDDNLAGHSVPCHRVVWTFVGAKRTPGKFPSENALPPLDLPRHSP